MMVSKGGIEYKEIFKDLAKLSKSKVKVCISNRNPLEITFQWDTELQHIVQVRQQPKELQEFINKFTMSKNLTK